jgi:hypothetical protein
MQAIKWPTAFGVAATLFLFAWHLEGYAYSLPGIPPSGSPYFLNDVKVDYNENSGQIKVTGRQNFSFHTDEKIYTGNFSRSKPRKIKGGGPRRGYFARVSTSRSRSEGNSAANDTSKYSLVGQFNDFGFISGTLSIRGGINSLNIPKNTLLMTADLTDWNIVDDPLLWGFATSNIWCSPLLLIDCTENESVYVVLDEPFNIFENSIFKSSAVAITTVPIPAALIMFLSGIAVLVLARYPGRNINKL